MITMTELQAIKMAMALESDGHRTLFLKEGSLERLDFYTDTEKVVISQEDEKWHLNTYDHYGTNPELSARMPFFLELVRGIYSSTCEEKITTDFDEIERGLKNIIEKVRKAFKTMHIKETKLEIYNANEVYIYGELAAESGKNYCFTFLEKNDPNCEMTVQMDIVPLQLTLQTSKDLLLEAIGKLLNGHELFEDILHTLADKRNFEFVAAQDFQGVSEYSLGNYFDYMAAKGEAIFPFVTRTLCGEYSPDGNVKFISHEKCLEDILLETGQKWTVEIMEDTPNWEDF